MKIGIVGCGRWGTFISWYLERAGHEVTLYGRENSQNFIKLNSERKNDCITLGEGIRLTSRLEDICQSDIIVISIGAQKLRSFMQELSRYDVKNKIFCLCMKGLEMETGERLSVIVEQSTDPSNKVAVWLGPGHVQEFYNGIPNLMVIDSRHEDVKKLLISEFSGDMIRFYYGEDIIGSEVGAAAKNVVGIAAGALDGLGLSSLKGALMSRGAKEVSKLISAMGGNPLSAYGLCHLGDYEATVFSRHSHNRAFGESIVKGGGYDKLAEGCQTAKAIKLLADKYGVDMPVCSAVYEVIYCGADVKETLNKIFERALKAEFN